jgi:hypothetical protein
LPHPQPHIHPSKKKSSHREEDLTSVTDNPCKIKGGRQPNFLFGVQPQGMAWDFFAWQV